MAQQVGNSYVHIQSTASASWTITHNLGNYPIIDVMIDVNGALTKIIPKDIVIVDMNTVHVEFSQVHTGQARLV